MSDVGSIALAMQNAVQAINALNKTIQATLPYAQSTAATATGGAATLPGNPVGFIVITNPTTGLPVKIPYYAT
jgi:hypothetical protein